MQPSVPRKKNKGEASDSKAMLAKVEKEVEDDDNSTMRAHVPLEKRWGGTKL